MCNLKKFFQRWVGRYLLITVCAATALLGAQQPREPDVDSAGLQTPTYAPQPANVQLPPELRGDIYMARKLYLQAVDEYRKPPQSAALFNKIGIAFQEMGQLNLAIQNYRRALKLNPAFTDSINNLGTVYYAERSYKKSIVYYKRALKYAGPSASVYANLGAAYFGRRDYKRASIYYENALQIDPEALEHHGTFGTLMQERTATEIALFHFYLAKTYAKRGSDDRALLYLRKAMEEGLSERKNLQDLPEFSSLKNRPDFQELLAENPRAL